MKKYLVSNLQPMRKAALAELCKEEGINPEELTKEKMIDALLVIEADSTTVKITDDVVSVAPEDKERDAENAARAKMLYERELAKRCRGRVCGDYETELARRRGVGTTHLSGPDAMRAEIERRRRGSYSGK